MFPEGSGTVSGVRRVITGVSGSPGSLRALRYAAEVAQVRGALLIPVLAWVPPGGDLADRRCPSAYLRETWRAAAVERLTETIDLAFGGRPTTSSCGPPCCAARPGPSWSPRPASRAT